MDIYAILKEGVNKACSDIYIKAGAPPTLRIDGELVPIDAPVLTAEETYSMAIKLMGQEKAKKYNTGVEVDFAFEREGLSRFRVNVFKQRETTSMVLRLLPQEIPDFLSLGLPASVEKLANERRGLILVTGTTGSGKTTTLASIINYINATRPCHIVTIEDPIEITYKDKKGLIEQREIGNDTQSYASALKYVLRQAPDVILLGEMRDLETVQAALQAAETGHLVLSTLHTINATETLNRLIDFFPEREVQQVRQTLAGCLKGIVSQRLIQRVDGNGRIPAVEIFISNLTIRSYILEKQKMQEIPKIMAKSEYDGMQTFDQSLLMLYNEEIISMNDALQNANSPNDLKVQMSQTKRKSEISEAEEETDSTESSSETTTSSRLGSYGYK